MAYQHRGAPNRDRTVTDPDTRLDGRGYDPLVPIGDRYAPGYHGGRVKIDSLQQCEERMNQLHEQNLHLAQKIERVAARLEELARNGGVYGPGGRAGFNGGAYYNGQGNAYGYNSRYLDGPNSASYLDSVRRDDAERRGRYADNTLGGGRTGGLRGGDTWERDDTDKMDTSGNKDKN